jgi:outer membrane protein insertion porin family
MSSFFKLLFSFFFYFIFFSSSVLSEVVNDIKISGNDRISNDTVLMFSDVKIGSNLDENDLNNILKNLYETNFFKNVSIKLSENLLTLDLEEAPLIQNIVLTGIKAKKYKDLILENLTIKDKSPFNKIIVKQQLETIKSLLRSRGFYFAEADVSIKESDNNLVDLEYIVDIGEKSKILKISFIGDKIYKNRKLKSLIISEEYKFWKFISGKKYLQEQLIELDKRLLKNFYLNNGYYNAEINSSFAKIVNDNMFELVFNIKPGEKVLFGDLRLVLPIDFDENNYNELKVLLSGLNDTPYSINSVEKILSEINKITVEEEFNTIEANIEESIVENKLNIDFIIKEADKYFIEKINIFGNNITQENVIRNQLIIDEGDPFSDLLAKKSENNIKSLNFFKKVDTKIVDGTSEKSKIINIEVQEKPTGEITAGAGAGTDGGTVTFGVKENNYLGRGISLNTNATISTETFKGLFQITNPNYKNSDKSLYFNLEATETDKLKNNGYKTTKNSFSIGTSFEYFDDFYLGITSKNLFEKIETNSTASALQKKQKGNYYDSFLKLDLNLDKRNQRYQTSDGFYSNYDLLLPLISDTNTITNSYNYRVFSELYENNVSSFSLFLSNATSLTGDNVKLSERLSLPSNILRGFEKGKVGPKDGKDFIGGNNLIGINLQSNLPMFFENNQNVDAVVFFDAANVWGVDYDSSINDSSKIRSSIGFGFDWLTPVGPLNFSFSQAITKEDTDKEEFFRFNLGTTF